MATSTIRRMTPRNDPFLTHPEGPTRAGRESWSVDTRRRAEVMVHAAPIYRAAFAQGGVAEELRHYDLLDLALRVIELTLESDGLIDLVTSQWLVDALRPALAQMDAAHGLSLESAGTRHARMVARVLDALRNEVGRRGPFEESIFDPTLPSPHRRVVEFRLLEDRHHPSGGVTIRPTAEATNLYLRALDQDLASQQHATEAMLAFQFARGALDAAELAARDARRLSRRHLEVITRELEQTERDVGLVDWDHHMPTMLRDAEGHLTVRVRTEAQLLSEAEERLTQVEPGSDPAQQIVRIRDLVSATQGDHLRLLTLLTGARQRFLDAQSRQRFRPPVAHTVPDLRLDLLDGALRRPPTAVAAGIDALLAAMLPPVVPAVWLCDRQLLWNLAEARRSDEDAGAAAAPLALEALPPELLAFPPAVRAAGEAALVAALARAGNEGVNLSTVLGAHYRADDPMAEATAHYIALRALWSTDRDPPADGEDMRRLNELTRMLGIVTDEPFLLGPFGGTDLLLTLQDTPTQSPVASPASTTPQAA